MHEETSNLMNYVMDFVDCHCSHPTQKEELILDIILQLHINRLKIKGIDHAKTSTYVTQAIGTQLQKK